MLVSVVVGGRGGCCACMFVWLLVGSVGRWERGVKGKEFLGVTQGDAGNVCG